MKKRTTANLAVIFQSGLGHHKAGRLAEAEAAYRQVLARQPDHPDALHLMGAIALQVGKPAAAVSLIQQALKHAPRGNPAYFSNLGSALRQLGRLDEALQACRQAIALDAGFVDGLNNLANILVDLGAHDQAAEALRRLIQLRPKLTEPRLLLARMLLQGGHAEPAAAELQTLMGLSPPSAAAYGLLGVALKRLGRYDEAVVAYQRALELRPDEPEIANNFGILLHELNRYDESALSLRRAIAAKPEFAEAHLNLSLTCRSAMRLEEAIAAARSAIQLHPQFAEAHTNLGFCLLITGQLPEGFTEYEWRSRMTDFPSPRRSFTSPVWDGTGVTGRTLLVHDEQGVGDTIQFVRYAQLLQAQGAQVFVECNRQLTRLLSHMPGIEGVVPRLTPPPPHDAHVSLLSLPHWLGTTLDHIPADIPYLRAEPERIERWGARLGPRQELRVGLIWAGNPEFKADSIRSPRLQAFLPFMDVPGVAFYGLQKGAGRQDLERCRPLPENFTDLGAEIDDFADTAAIMAHLDLIISSCTAPAHLAGALGRPVWTILPFAPDWRWLVHGDTTPWYPTMRLFRQDRCGDWGPVISRVRTALEGLHAPGASSVARDPEKQLPLI